MDWTSLIGPALGAAGAYFGAQQGGPQTNTQTQMQDPEYRNQWGAYRDFSNQLAMQPYNPYQGQRVAGFTQDQYGAMDQVRNLAGGGAEMQAGSQALQGVLNATPGSNPYLDGMIKRTNDDVQARMGTGAFSSGSFGNSGVAQATATGLADSANTLRFNAYESDMGRKMQGIGMGLGYQDARMQGAQALQRSGAAQQMLGQAYLDDDYARFQEHQNYPNQQLGYLGASLGMGSPGSSSSTTTPGNRWASAIGGGLLGLQLGNQAAGMVGGAPRNQMYGNMISGQYGAEY